MANSKESYHVGVVSSGVPKIPDNVIQELQRNAIRKDYRIEVTFFTNAHPSEIAYVFKDFILKNHVVTVKMRVIPFSLQEVYDYIMANNIDLLIIAIPDAEIVSRLKELASRSHNIEKLLEIS